MRNSELRSRFFARQSDIAHRGADDPMPEAGRSYPPKRVPAAALYPPMK